MPLTIYSSKANGQGAALFASFNSKDQAGYFKLVKQTGWDATKKVGSFKGGSILNIKLSGDELGSICRAIRLPELDSPISFYHNFGGAVTSGKFSYYEIPVEGKSPRKGFGLSFKKDNEEFKLGISLGGAERLYEFIRFAYDHIFSAVYVADKKEFEARQKEKEAEAKQPAKVAPAPEPEADEEDKGGDDIDF